MNFTSLQKGYIQQLKKAFYEQKIKKGRFFVGFKNKKGILNQNYKKNRK